jgi:hypothetical protein
MVLAIKMDRQTKLTISTVIWRFRYLRLDKILDVEQTSLNISKPRLSLDYTRQNNWNDAFV